MNEKFVSKKITGGNLNLDKEISVILDRAISDQFRECRICTIKTPRVLMFKKPSDPVWDLIWICDNCFEGIQKMKVDKIGI
jgi:hypothetical protein